MSARWLVTGGCGFIGRNLCRRLIDDNCAVRVLDDESVGHFDDLKFAAPCAERESIWPSDAGVHVVTGDVRDENIVREVTAGADVVVHLAANTGVGPSVEDPRLDCTTNVFGTFNCLEAARHAGVRRFVFASSGAPLGTATPPIHEELAAHPLSPYGASKAAGEAYCSAWFHSFGLETVALRFGNVYGPWSGHKSSVVAKFIRQAFDGEAWEIYGDGGQTRDFIHVHDLTGAIVRASEAANIGGEVFQIATNAETTVRDLAHRLSEAMRGRGIEPGAVEFGEVRTGDMPRNYSNITKARERLRWSPRIDLGAGLAETLDWFLTQRSSSPTSTPT